MLLTGDTDLGTRVYNGVAYCSRYGEFIKEYIDLGVYRWDKQLDKREIEMRDRTLWFPKGEVSGRLKLEPNVHRTRLGYLIEARFLSASESEQDNSDGRNETDKEGGATVSEDKGETGEEVTEEGKEGVTVQGELVGRAFSKSKKIAQERAQEKLFQRTLPSHPATNP